jgi:hypothetical protein
MAVDFRLNLASRSGQGNCRQTGHSSSLAEPEGVQIRLLQPNSNLQASHSFFLQELIQGLNPFFFQNSA